MEENTPTPDEIIQKLKSQNYELAQRLQFWRLESNRLMNDKHIVMKENNDLAIENNSYREQLLKFRNMENLIKQNLTRSLTDIVNGSEHIRKTLEVFSNQTTELREQTSSPKRNISTVLTNNVNHVHPMIKGITIKKPVIRISRAIFDPEPIASTVSTDTNSLAEDAVQSESISSRDVLAPTQQVEMLDLCVSLCRVDSPSRRVISRTPKQVFPSPTSQVPRNDAFSQPSNSPLRARTVTNEPEQEAGVEDHNANDLFTDGDGGTANFLPDGCFEYRSRLECLIEESDISSKLISSPKPNPFVALSRTLEDETLESSKSEQNNQSSIVDEDPLEGPSWRFDNVTTRRDRFVVTRKKKKISNSTTSNSKNEESQMPDSTTNNASSKDVSQEETSLFDKTYPAAPDYQSTPVGNPQIINKKIEETPEHNGTVVPSPAIESLQEPQFKMRKKQLHAKVVLDAMKTDSAKTSPRRKQPKAKTEKKTKSKSEPEVTTPKKPSEPTLPNTPSSRGSTLLFRLSSEETSIEQRVLGRPRRGAPKDYKEKNLRRKMRNENSAP